jgi:hypothetical protein
MYHKQLPPWPTTQESNDLAYTMTVYIWYGTGGWAMSMLFDTRLFCILKFLWAILLSCEIKLRSFQSDVVGSAINSGHYICQTSLSATHLGSAKKPLNQFIFMGKHLRQTTNIKLISKQTLSYNKYWIPMLMFVSKLQ